VVRDVVVLTDVVTLVEVIEVVAVLVVLSEEVAVVVVVGDVLDGVHSTGDASVAAAETNSVAGSHDLDSTKHPSESTGLVNVTSGLYPALPLDVTVVPAALTENCVANWKGADSRPDMNLATTPPPLCGTACTTDMPTAAKSGAANAAPKATVYACD
jgi:hypothetical protein